MAGNKGRAIISIGYRVDLDLLAAFHWQVYSESFGPINGSRGWRHNGILDEHGQKT
jgi:hypothetical protein